MIKAVKKSSFISSNLLNLTSTVWYQTLVLLCQVYFNIKYQLVVDVMFTGCKKSVNFSLTNKDCSIKNHKFLLMYHSVDFFDGNVKEFWNCHEYADTRYEHT